MNARNASRLPAAIALPALFVALLSAPAFADGDPATDGVPRMLPYNGVLELDGRPVEATGENALHLLFSLYDGAGAEQPTYSQPLVVDVYDGRFTATIGPTGIGPDGAAVAIDAVIGAADDLYLGITLLGDPDDPADDVALANRQRIYATPYAMWSTVATDLSVARNAVIGGDLTVAGAAAFENGVRVTGPVELPAGSLDLDDLAPETIGDSMTRDGRAMNVDEAWLDGRIRGWVRDHCTVRLGWRNDCGNCDQPPAREVTVRADGTCVDASGNNTRCRSNSTWGGVATGGGIFGGGAAGDVAYVRMICN